MNGFIWLLSHDEVNQNLVRDLGAAHELETQPLLLKEGMPDGDCRALIVDLDSVASDRRTLQRLIKELEGRARAYPVTAFGYSVEEEQLRNLKAAGIQVFEHGLEPALLAAIIEQASQAPLEGSGNPSRDGKGASQHPLPNGRGSIEAVTE